MSDSKRIEQTCRCLTYKFPHRLGSGDCMNTKLEPPFCSVCGCSCRSFQIDVGNGAYEFWGQRGFDSQIVDVSDCCEGDLEQTQEDCKGD